VLGSFESIAIDALELAKTFGSLAIYAGRVRKHQNVCVEDD
jgi:hypothetical protein